MGFPGGSDSNESACNVGDQVWSLDWEDLLEKGMATHSSILSWRIPWTEEPGGLQSMGLQRVGQDWATKTHAHTHTHTHTHTYTQRGVVGREEGKWAKSNKLLPNSKESHVSWYRFSTWSFGQWKLTDIYKQESDKIDLCLRTKLWGLCGGWARFGERLAIGDTWEAIAVIKMRVNKSLV